jgi:hypothetical protein
LSQQQNFPVLVHHLQTSLTPQSPQEQQTQPSGLTALVPSFQLAHFRIPLVVLGLTHPRSLELLNYRLVSGLHLHLSMLTSTLLPPSTSPKWLLLQHPV